MNKPVSTDKCHRAPSAVVALLVVDALTDGELADRPGTPSIPIHGYGRLTIVSGRHVGAGPPWFENDLVCGDIADEVEEAS